MASYSSMSQIFKYVVPITLLTDLLDKICEPTDEEYWIDHNAYKRMKLHGYHAPFLETLAPYYHLSKRIYIEREITQSTFMTIVRQICRIHNIDVRPRDSADGNSYAVAKPIESL